MKTKKFPKPVWPKPFNSLDAGGRTGTYPKRTFAQRMMQARWMKGGRATWLTLFHADLYASMTKAGVPVERRIWLDSLPSRSDSHYGGTTVYAVRGSPLSERVAAFARAWLQKHATELREEVGLHIYPSVADEEPDPLFVGYLAYNSYAPASVSPNIRESPNFADDALYDDGYDLHDDFY